MKAFVITIEGHTKSEQAAKRCIKSAKKFGMNVETFKAITPKDKPQKMLESREIPVTGFKEVYSRLNNLLASFMSHYSLWELSVKLNEDIIIFEHDAVVIGNIPEDIRFDKVMTFSKPSYGKFNTPTKIGVGPLVQKQYFGGAHGYIVSPRGAQELMDMAKINPRPTDVFMNTDNFPWLEELYPWVCYAADSFTTIQNTKGCLAKHRYSEGYEIEDV